MSTATIAPGKKGLKNAIEKLREMLDIFGRSPEELTPAERMQAITGYELRHRIEALVSAVTKKSIKFVYTGSGAATGVGIMILPRIPNTMLFSPREVGIILGYTAHEISHQLFTDFGMIDTLYADMSKPTRREQQHKEFWNALEDYRIERENRAEFPGFHHFIDHTRDHTAARFVRDVEKGGYPEKALSNPYRIGSVGLTWVGAAINGYRTTKPAEALSKLPADLAKWLGGWEPEMRAMATCADAKDLAGRILDELDRMRQNPEEEEPDQPEGEGQASNDPGEGGESGKGGSGKGGSGSEAGSGKDRTEDPETAGKPDDAEKTDGSDAGPDADASTTDPKAKPDGEGSKSEAGPDTDEQPKNGGDTDSEGDAEGQKDEGGEGPASSGHGDDDGDDNGATSKADDEASGPEGIAGDAATADAGGTGASSKGEGSPNGEKKRPDIKVREGDQEEKAEEADLEIDEIVEAITKACGKDEDQTSADVSGSEEIATGGGTDQEAITNRIRGSSNYTRLRAEVGPAAAQSAGVVRRLLQSKNRTKTRTGLEDGELDFGRLVPMSLGRQDVYRETRTTPQVNTAVSLLLDNSGSMGGNPLHVCQKTAIVLDMAVQGTKTAFEVTGFTSGMQGSKVYIYRNYAQKGVQASASLGNMDTVTLGGTPVAIPLLEAWRRLRERREPRKVMIIVSDGGADDPAKAKEARRIVELQGGIVIGIAIGHIGPMKKWCDKTVAITDVSELPKALTTLIKEYVA